MGLTLPNCARDQGSNPAHIYSAALEAEAGATKHTSLPIIITTLRAAREQASLTAGLQFHPTTLFKTPPASAVFPRIPVQFTWQYLLLVREMPALSP